MIDFQALKAEYNRLIEQLSSPSLEVKERAVLQRKANHYATILSLHEQMEALEKEISDLEEAQQSESDNALRELIEDEVITLKNQHEKLLKELDDALYPSDEHDERSVYLEVRAGAGGQEAALFVGDLFSMYQLYAESRRWEISIVDSSMTDIGGYKELILYVKGKNVYKYLKFESGVHRVQRVPATETQGRVHTSTVTVAVMPEADDIDISINPNDLRVDTYRAGGAGGQHVNKTDSAVRITHLPTGIVVQCQDERSQIKNRAKALKVLQARLLEAEKEKQAAEQSQNRKQQVGTGERAEKIRTYNFPQNRVTDHRINLTLKKLEYIMRGDLEELLEPLLDWDRRHRKEQAEHTLFAS